MEAAAARPGRAVTLGALLTALALCAPLTIPASAQAARCAPIKNPYPNSRYAGEPLYRIRTAHASCRTGRAVARGAHYKALSLPIPVSGIRRFRWRGWRVTGDIRPAHDRYRAVKGRRRVTWRF